MCAEIKYIVILRNSFFVERLLVLKWVVIRERLGTTPLIVLTEVLTR